MNGHLNYGLTVEQLYHECARVIKEGHGKKHILISTDDEGNGFHTLFYGIQTSQDEINSTYEYCLIDSSEKPEHVVLLG